MEDRRAEHLSRFSKPSSFWVSSRRPSERRGGSDDVSDASRLPRRVIPSHAVRAVHQEAAEGVPSNRYRRGVQARTHRMAGRPLLGDRRGDVVTDYFDTAECELRQIIAQARMLNPSGMAQAP